MTPDVAPPALGGAVQAGVSPQCFLDRGRSGTWLQKSKDNVLVSVMRDALAEPTEQCVVEEDIPYAVAGSSRSPQSPVGHPWPA